MADFAKILRKQNKNVLLLLAEEFETEVSSTEKNLAIIKAITSAPDFEVELAHDFLDRILAEKKDEEERERDRHVAEERERERQFELQKIKLQQAAETQSLNSASSSGAENRERKNVVKDLVPKLDLKSMDVTLFFTVFERQARKIELDASEWVTNLIPLLPAEMTELIVREPVELADDYSHVKKILMKRYQLGATELKVRFESHTRKPGSLWADFAYDLTVYFENWLESVGVDDFNSLKELIIAERIKSKVPWEIKNHFLDTWEELVKVEDIINKCDKYESARRANFKFEKKFNDSKFQFKDKPKVPDGKNKIPQPKVNSTENKGSAEKSRVGKTFNFEKKREVYCFHCSKPGHIRPNCALYLEKKRLEEVNRVESDIGLGECFQPYLNKARINGIERYFLRDTGSSLDIIDEDWVNHEDYNGEYVWLRQALDDTCKCLPLARIVLEGDFGKVSTKAAVRQAGVSKKYYLLGNKTFELIERQKAESQIVNRVETRSQRAEKNIKEVDPHNGPSRSGLAEGNKPVKEVDGLEGSLTEEENEQVDIPKPEEVEKTMMFGLSKKDFLTEQSNCMSLSALREKAKDGKEFVYEEGCLMRKNKSKRGDIRLQICIPLKFRLELIKLCHEEIGGHLGVTKTKDRLLRYYFWPNCYYEIECFIRSCDACQRVGKSRDKFKAPLKLVPIISEVFSKVNIDGVGPLPLSSKNNRYLITCLCVASKYPEAVPVENLTSVSVIKALVQIFSRIGFPRLVQCDLGRSFVSELTSEFFRKFGIKVVHSSVSRPQSNVVERVHKTLKRVLKVLCLENGEDWEENLSMALFSLRTVTHESTGFSPAELVHGKNLRMPQTILYENWSGKESVDQNVVDYILTLHNRLKECQELAGQQMREAQIKRKTWYDRNAVKRTFKPGDKVLVLVTSKANKMAVNWMGPGVISAVISETNYLVELPERRDKSTIYHVNLIKPYHSRPEHVNLLLGELDEEIEREAEIPYPLANSTHLDFFELVSESKLTERVNEAQLNQLRKVIERNAEVFSSDPGNTQLITMDIELENNMPIRARPYCMSPWQIDIWKGEIKRLVELGGIEVGQSDYKSPKILVECPGKDPPPCADYNRLNTKTRIKFYLFPKIEEGVEKVSALSFISVMDLSKLALFRFLNATFYCCHLISKGLNGLENVAVPYMEDLCIFSEDWKSCLIGLETVPGRLKDARLTVDPGG